MNLTLEDQYFIYNHYIAEVTNRDLRVGKSMNCPFPDSPEYNPSFSIFPNREKDALLWKLWNNGETGNVYSFVARMEEKPVGLASQLIMKILISNSTERKTVNASQLSATPDAIVGVRNYFTIRELKYWDNEAGLSESDLIALDIYPLKSLSYDGKKISMLSTNSEPKFVYPFFKGDSKMTNDIVAWQVYNPKTRNRKRKWRSGGDPTVGNAHNLPRRSDKLYWTTSKKDGGVLWKHVLNKKYPFIHSPKEMQTDIVIDLINSEGFRDRFPEIIYVPDIEWVGEKMVRGKMQYAPGYVRAQKLKEEHGIKCLNVEYPDNAKDVCDLYKINKLNLIKDGLYF